MAVDLDGDRRVDADRDRVLAARIERPASSVSLVSGAQRVQRRVQLAHAASREVDASASRARSQK